MRKARKKASRYSDETPIITDERDVPAGFVRISTLVPPDAPRAKTLLKALSDAHKMGGLPARKLVRKISEIRIGAVFVDREQAEAILRARVAEWEMSKAAIPKGNGKTVMDPMPEPSDEGYSNHAEPVDKSLARMVELMGQRITFVEGEVKAIGEDVEETKSAVMRLLTIVSDIRAAMELRLEAESFAVVSES